MTDGELKNKIVAFGYTVEGEPLMIHTEHLDLVLAEAISEFPCYQWNAIGWEKYDRAEVDAWLKKWFGSIDGKKETVSK